MARATNNPRTLPPELRQRLNKLMLMMSSDHDGERSAAAAAITKALVAAGFDWHDLVGGYTPPPPPHSSSSSASPPPPPPPPPPPTATPPPQPPPRPTSSRPTSWSDGAGGMEIMGPELIETVEQMRKVRRFNAASEEFLDGLIERAFMYDIVFLSARQVDWFKSLVRQASRAV